MKKSFYLIISLLILGSCATSNDVVSNNILSKRKYRQGYNFNGKGVILKSTTSQENKQVATADPKISDPDNRIASNNSIGLSYSEINFDHAHSLTAGNSNQIYDFENIRINRVNLDNKNENDCEEIIKRDGDIIEAKIIEVGVTEIKYKKCSNIEGPTYNILKSDVFMIKYKNGDKDVFTDENSSSSNQKGSANKNVEPFSIVSLSSGITGLILGLLISMGVGIFLGILGIIFGAISLKRIKSNPNKYSENSKKLAKAGLITGVVISALSTAILILLFL